MINAQGWIRILEENFLSFIFWIITLRFVGNRRVHGDFENIFTIETHLGSHAINQKTKPKSEGSRSQRIRTLDMQPSHSNKAENKLKYSEASRSSFLKLVFSKTQPNRGHAKNTTQTYIYSWLTWEGLKKYKSPHIAQGIEIYT